MKKLLQIQTELKAPKNQYNAFGKYKYRNQEDILEALKPLLKEHECGLTITDEIKTVGELVFVEATARFNDGSEVTEVKAQAGIDPNRKGMDISQSFGSSSSYARKYALNGLFLIDDTKDADATNEHGKGKTSDKKALTELGVILKEYSNKDELKKNMTAIRDKFIEKGVDEIETQKLIKARYNAIS